MKFDFLKDKKCWCFAAGIATAVVGRSCKGYEVPARG